MQEENAEKMRDISRNLKTISASNAALVNLEEDLRTAVSQGRHTLTPHTHTHHTNLHVTFASGAL